MFFFRYIMLLGRCGMWIMNISEYIIEFDVMNKFKAKKIWIIMMISDRDLFFVPNLRVCYYID